MSIERVDHVAAALARLPTQFRDLPGWEAVITALVSPLQETEDTLLAIYAGLLIDTSTGYMLRLLARLVGQPYDDITDDDLLRRYVKARIAANNSGGTRKDNITVARLILNDPDVRVQIREVWPATIIVELEDVPVDPDVAAVVAAFIHGREKGSASAAVGTRVTYSEYPIDETFRLGICAMSAAIAASAATIDTDGLRPVGKFPPGGGLIELRGEDSLGDEHVEVLEYVAYTYNAATNVGTFTLLPPAVTAYDYAARLNRVPGGGNVAALITLIEPTVERGLDGPMSISAAGTFDVVITAGPTYTVSIPAGLYTPRQMGAIIAAQVAAEPTLIAAMGYDDGLEIWYLYFFHGSATVTVQNFSTTTLRGELGYTTDPTGPANPLLPPNGMNTGNGGRLGGQVT